jgi:hypothetical protein
VRVCFHHEDFDRDVSSGTIHSLHQWVELCNAFSVGQCAIINRSDGPIPAISGPVVVLEFGSLADFLSGTDGEKTYVERGGPNFRDADLSAVDWVVFGGTGGLPEADLSIETGLVALYPRLAAAIIMEAVAWQSP